MGRPVGRAKKGPKSFHTAQVIGSIPAAATPTTQSGVDSDRSFAGQFFNGSPRDPCLLFSVVRVPHDEHRLMAKALERDCSTMDPTYDMKARKLGEITSYGLGRDRESLC